MILDTSAVVAILLKEPDYAEYSSAIATARVKRLSTMSYFECSIVLMRYGRIGIDGLDEFIEREGIELVDFTQGHARLARRAYARYGRSHHRAALNFGDCASYAVAADLGEPLLYKGNDFAQTDV